MLRKLFVGLFLLGISVTVVGAQEDCSSEDINDRADDIIATYLASRADIEDTTEALREVEALGNDLAELRELCAGSDEEVTYSEIPQARTEDGAFVLGDPDVPITIIEFADFLCPHCQEYEPTIQRFIREYVATGKARLEFRSLPAVDPTYSPIAARLAECSAELKPGSFWEAHDTLFDIAMRTRFGSESPRAFAEAMDLNYSDVLDCIREADQVTTDVELAQEMGVQGTPAIMVRYDDNEPEWIQFNGQTLNRSAVNFEVLAAIVEDAQ